jgi:hypothetical protein
VSMAAPISLRALIAYDGYSIIEIKERA